MLLKFSIKLILHMNIYRFFKFCRISSDSPVHFVRFFQRVSTLFFETVNRLFAVPNCFWERELFPEPIFVHSAQGSTSDFFRFQVMRSIPHLLQFVMVSVMKNE